MGVSDTWKIEFQRSTVQRFKSYEGVSFPEKKSYITLEWPLLHVEGSICVPISRDFSRTYSGLCRRTTNVSRSSWSTGRSTAIHGRTSTLKFHWSSSITKRSVSPLPVSIRDAQPTRMLFDRNVTRKSGGYNLSGMHNRPVRHSIDMSLRNQHDMCGA